MIDQCPTIVAGIMGSRVIMNIRRWVLRPPVIALFILAAVAFVPVLAQQQGQKVDKKVEKAQAFDLQSAVNAANAAMAGQPAADFTMSFKSDSWKARPTCRSRCRSTRPRPLPARR
jgi:hypothetical protein